MKEMHILFSHHLTKEQKDEVVLNFHVEKFIPLPQKLQLIWSNIPASETNISKYIRTFTDYLTDNSKSGDLVLIQGDYGLTYAIVDWCLKNQRLPLYSTTQRSSEEYQEQNGVVKKESLFKHVIYRRYTKAEI
jgi:hypothetical protein